LPRKRPDGPELKWRRNAWEVEFYEGDIRRRIATGTTDEQSAKQFLADFQNKQAAAPKRSSFGDALDRYEADRKGKVAAYSRLLEATKPLRAALEYLRVDQIDQGRWDTYAKERVTQPHRRAKPGTHKARPVSSGTLRREFNVLRAALHLAHKQDILAKVPAMDPPKDSKARDRYLTKDEARALLAACIEPHVKVFLALAVFTGARKSSILALEWDRVSFATGKIDFQEPGRAETSKRRAIVPMNDSLRAALEKAYEVKKTGFVVEYGEKAVPYGMRKTFDQLCIRAGLTWRPTPHHLKHSVISWLAMGGVPIDQASDLVATDPATLRRTYRKFDPSYLRGAAQALEL